MKKFLKENIKLIVVFFLGVIVSTSITGYAVNSYMSNQVRYTSDRSILAVNNVNAALDELYLSSTLGVPIGTILPLMRTNAPGGYLKCDGAIYNIADYKNLADAIKEDFGSYNYFGGDGTTTFAVPDLRGEFLRGTGTNSHTNQGSGANIGEHQDGTSFPDYYTDSVNSVVITKADASNRDTNISGITRGYAGSFGTDQYGGMFTSRPTNTSVLYVIKY